MRGNRVLAIIMSVVLVAGLLPAPALAVGLAGAGVRVQGTRDAPAALAVGTPVSGRTGFLDDQWYVFTTSASHSVYSIQITSRENGKTVRFELYDTAGDRVGHRATSTTDAESFLLASASSYKVRVSEILSGEADYDLAVTEQPSDPQYAALGKDRNNPYRLQLGKGVNSQFDDPSGSQEQWYTFNTGTVKKPTFIRFADKSATGSVRYDLYDARGKLVDYVRASTLRTDAYALAKNAAYTIKVSASYTQDTGFPSYQLGVSQVKPGKVSKLKAKKVRRTGFTVTYGASKNANRYQVAYKKAGARKWTTAKNVGRSWTSYGLKAKTKYKVKVRGAYYVDGTWYFGSWSKAATVKTKG